MFEGIDPRSPTPLYEQIAAEIRMAIAVGDLTAGDVLPSVRGLAGELRVNPATVVQAYRELAMDGFIEKRHGAGTFVREVPTRQKEEERVARAAEIAREALQAAARAGIQTDDLIDAIRAVTGSASNVGEFAHE